MIFDQFRFGDSDVTKIRLSAVSSANELIDGLIDWLTASRHISAKKRC